MQSFKKILINILIVLFPFGLNAQIKPIGTPFIHNYTRSSYQAGSQTWDIEQGSNGMMYFANNNGLLEFDGSYWNVYPLPNKSVLRSIEMGNESLLYAGGFNELGYYTINEMGGATYTSLTHLIPEEKRNFKDVWRIYIHPDGVIFQTYGQLMFYRDDTIKIIDAPSSFYFSFLVNNEYYVNDLKKGLMRYALGKLHPLIGMESLKGKEIWGMLPMDDGSLVITVSDGVYVYDGHSLILWDIPSAKFLEKNQIYSVLHLSNNLFVFGTVQNGLLFCDNEGQPIQHISMEDGLQNNTILCINQDGNGNLWLGTDLGIDYIEINSPLSQLSFNYGLSTGYAAIEYNDMLYMGTNQGLFVNKSERFEENGFEAKKMELIEGTNGQVWVLDEIDGQLFCGHNNGTFIIKDKTAEKITDTPGGWTFLQTPNDSLKIIGGNYSGIALYQKTDNKWAFSQQVRGFSESARTLAFDLDGSLWMAHGYKGIFHLFFSEGYDSIIKVELYDNNNSNLSSSDVSLAKLGDEIIFTSQEDIYSFSISEKDFIPNKKWRTLFNGNNIRSIKEDKFNNIWYFHNNKAEVLRLREDGNYTNINLPFRQIDDEFVKAFEYVYPLGEHDVFFGVENGFTHYNPTYAKNYAYPFKTYLKFMRVSNPDTTYFFNDNPHELILEYSSNDIEFLYSANDYENTGQIKFATMMQGYDEDWSDWQLKNSREFTNLNEGEYVFKVKAINIYGTESNQASIVFKVLPPFHRSLIAFILYGIAIVISIIIFGWILKRRFERAKSKSEKEQEEQFKRKEEKFQRDALEAEKQLIKMRNEKLREEMTMRDKELANLTMQMIQNNKFLISQTKSLELLASTLDDPEKKFEIKKIIQKNNKAINNEDQWKIFELHFENVHEEFLKRIKTAFPKLSPIELKLCAYLRMNISSKEIAALMNISVRGVEISRYRLRKKLNLNRSNNLTEFIVTF